MLERIHSRSGRDDDADYTIKNEIITVSQNPSGTDIYAEPHTETKLDPLRRHRRRDLQANTPASRKANLELIS